MGTASFHTSRLLVLKPYERMIYNNHTQYKATIAITWLKVSDVSNGKFYFNTFNIFPNVAPEIIIFCNFSLTPNYIVYKISNNY